MINSKARSDYSSPELTYSGATTQRRK